MLPFEQGIREDKNLLIGAIRNTERICRKDLGDWQWANTDRLQ